ncbi:nicotinate (nicotinamide) nucleotide adenylyltransferase [Sulfurimonas sp.]
METIALYGGSFDPPHIGHEEVVKALNNLSFIDKVIVMPTFLNPFKKSFIAPASLRLAWLKKMFSSFENVKISSYEVELKRKVPTIETVKYLKKNYKKIYLVIGADNLKSLEKWYKYEELKEEVTFIIAQRDNINISNDFIRLNVDKIISSSDLRKNIDMEKLPKTVAKEIVTYYKENNERQNTKDS